MRNRSIALVFLASVFLGPGGQTREPEKTRLGAPVVDDHAEAARLAQEAIERIKTQGVKGFIALANSGRPGYLKPLTNPEAAEGLIKYYDQTLATNLGKLIEHELVRTEVVGSSFVRFKYLEKREKGVMNWHFTFYRGGEQWKWNGYNVTFNQLNNEFQPATMEIKHAEATALAKIAAEAIKAGEISKLMDAVNTPGKTLITTDRFATELSLTSHYQTAMVNAGKPLGEVEWVRTDAIGPSLIRLVYLQKCSEDALVWKFTFYRVNGEWKWLDMNLDQRVNEFVEK